MNTKAREKNFNDVEEEVQDEKWYINRLINHCKMQISNTNKTLNLLIKEKRLLIGIKKKMKN